MTDQRENRMYPGTRFGAAGFLAVFALAPALLLSTIVSVTTPRTSSLVEYHKAKIVALSDSKSVEGSFFLGSGYVQEEVRYFFYFETPDGGKKLTSLPADAVTIYEEDRKDAFFAEVAKAQPEHRSRLVEFFAPEVAEDMFENKQISYAIHIPKGSIKENINLDLPK